MKVRGILALFLTLHAITGCEATFAIPVAEAPNLPRGGTVRTVNGGIEAVPAKYSVGLEPQDDQILLRPSQARPELVSAPYSYNYHPPQNPMPQAPWLEGPVNARFEGPNLHLLSWKDELIVDHKLVKWVSVRQFSAKKTVGLVLGLVGGAALVGLLVAVSNLNWGLGGR